ncbi:hypothetical protein EYF80_023932 [Liparis tanakae]|uniref:Uncharacterized protein n=1 Tax=Liparis tanakae TaxID=230148 RepID=A0A4Z2HJM1_9TELE|nr:hypothetical protein EYF80_023932 [Liparis tanakae]
MFICARPGVVVTTLIKDVSALMFYSSFMRQPYPQHSPPHRPNHSPARSLPSPVTPPMPLPPSPALSRPIVSLIAVRAPHWACPLSSRTLIGVITAQGPASYPCAPQFTTKASTDISLLPHWTPASQDRGASDPQSMNGPSAPLQLSPASY